MGHSESNSVSAPTVGLVVRDEPLAKRIRAVLKSSDLPVAFDLALDDLGDDGSDHGADVVLLVAQLGSDSKSLAGRVLERTQQAPLVSFMGTGPAPSLRWAIEKGAVGIVREEDLEDTLEVTLRAVHAGQMVVPRDVRRQRPDLTNREKQVLSLVIMGLTNREIAQKLYVSESTVKSHLNTAYRKLGVHSRTEAARVIADPHEGLGMGILAITESGLSHKRSSES